MRLPSRVLFISTNQPLEIALPQLHSTFCPSYLHFIDLNQFITQFNFCSKHTTLFKSSRVTNNYKCMYSNTFRNSRMFKHIQSQAHCFLRLACKFENVKKNWFKIILIVPQVCFFDTIGWFMKFKHI
jgi:hypothetical protein